MGTLATYKPLFVWCSPASIPQIVAHIQDYLVKNPIVSTETVAEIVVQSLQEHPELINGDVIPITEDSAQTIKEYIDALPSLDGYTKAETDALLLLKQNLLVWDQTPTVGSSNPVTSEGIKAAISASAAALADLISTKADIASVYTKATTDALLLQKADAATTYSKNAVDALLDTKVDINDTYTRADIDLMKQVDKANTAIVTDGTAPFNIAAGQYVYVNDILYMATEPIPEGDPLIPGTNIALNPKGVTNVIGDGLQNLAHTVGEQSDQIGNLTSLETTAKTDLVSAVNEVNKSVVPVQLSGSDVIDFNTSLVDYSVVQPTATASIIGKLVILNIRFHPVAVSTLADKNIGTLKSAVKPARNSLGQTFVVPVYDVRSTTKSVIAQAWPEGLLRFPNNGSYGDLDGQITTSTEITIIMIYAMA